jgi:predicted amidohydrolase
VKGIHLTDLYRAYRKAKSDAYFEKGHFHSLAFATYEENLEDNLNRLLGRLNQDASWALDQKFLGGYAYVPKAVESPKPSEGREIHFATLDPIEDWRRSWAVNGKRFEASFRPIICPTVDYQVVSALWIVKIGHKYDEKLDRSLVYAHRLKRVGSNGRVNEDSYQLYAPYFSGYRAWRSKGLEAIRGALDAGQSVIAVTMDIQSFYHSVSPKFLLRKSFLEANGIELSPEEIEFTSAFIQSMLMWYATTPEYLRRSDGALPVGLSASRLISNVLLAEFDRIVAEHKETIHYGRYADDIFLVVKSDASLRSGHDFIRWVRKQFDRYLVLDGQGNDVGLRLRLPYAKDSDIIFSSKKQKIFFLSGDHGLDLIGQIEEQIKRQSSEYRLLPELPETENEMLSLALLATPDARLQADALRKAEAVSLRRLGFSFLLGDFESYARDLDYRDPEWTAARLRFYGIVERYVLTPSGFFDYFVYVVRVFGLMVSCRDLESARKLLGSLERVARVLLETTTAGKEHLRQFQKACASYYRGFLHVALESATMQGFVVSRDYLKLIDNLSSLALLQVDQARVPELIRSLLLSDLGRRPYQEYWYTENVPHERQPSLPHVGWIKRILVTVRTFRAAAKKELVRPYWPAVVFPTRPPAVWQISLSVPAALSESGGIQKLLHAVRGGFVDSTMRDYCFIGSDEQGRRVISIPNDGEAVIGIAVPSFGTTESQWLAAVRGAPDHSLRRYIGLRRLVNEVMSSKSNVDYIVFPELSIPYWWALDISARLARNGISLIAGIEHHGRGVEYRNDVLISLVTNYYGRRSNLCFIQPKIALSHDEARNVKDEGKKFFAAALIDERRPIYQHGNIAFGVLICSDLTTIQNRAHFQGAIDALFVVEWNRDIDTFAFLVESAAHDLHAAIVQVNNRTYGDSRVRMPFAEAYRRDVVKVKGGSADFFVCCDIDLAALREFQSKPIRIRKPEKKRRKVDLFKPTPIGFKISKFRSFSKKGRRLDH